MLPRRVPGYRPELLDQLCATGEVVWVGAGLDRVALFFREDAAVARASGGARRRRRATRTTRVRAALSSSAEFWFDLLAATGLEAEAALPALWDLVWAGEVTNDAWQPLRAGRRYGDPEARAPAAPVLAHRATGDHRDPGPLVARRAPLRRRPGPARARRAPARAAGDRHPRRRPRRGDRRRLRRRLRRAEGAGDARALPARLLRRGPGRRAVRARRRGRAAARAPAARGRGAGAARPGGRRPGAALRRGAARGRSGRARGPRASPAPTSSSSAGAPALFVERGGTVDGAAARIPIRSGCGSRSPPWSTTRAASAASGWRSSGSTASRSRRARPAAPRRGRVPGRPAPRGAAAVSSTDSWRESRVPSSLRFEAQAPAIGRPTTSTSRSSGSSSA